MSTKQIEAVRAVAAAIVEAVEASGSQGAPSGVLYSALMGTGMNLSQYQSIMGTLERVGMIQRRGLLYFGKGVAL